MNRHTTSNWRYRGLLAVLLACLPAWSCQFDQGLGLLESRISGTVRFLGKALRPDNIDEVRVVATAAFPPTGIADVFFSEAIPFDRDSADYEILLPLGDYPAIAVLWRPRGKDWSFTSLLGFYGFEPPATAQLRGVTLTEAAPIAPDVDLFAIWSLAAINGEISGTLTFKNDLPADTETLLIGAFVQMPDLDRIANSLIFLGGLPLPVPLNSVTAGGTYTYRLPVRAGTYPFIGLFWVGKEKSYDDIRLAGFYPDPNNPALPGMVRVEPEIPAEQIDFTIDFSALNAGASFPPGQ